jgi:ATP-dependent DNA helicase RecQ
VDLDLLAYLKEVRRKLARSEDVPAYVIAPNRTLEAIAEARPVNRRGLEGVHGMGPSRMRRYGDTLLDAVRAWTGSHPGVA